MQAEHMLKIQDIAGKLKAHTGVEFAVDFRNTPSMAPSYALSTNDKEILIRLKTWDRVISSLEDDSTFARFAGNVAGYLSSEKRTPKIVVVVNDEPDFMEDAVVLARPI